MLLLIHDEKSESTLQVLVDADYVGGNFVNTFSLFT